jgi:Antibiotic biosynthesis monooxygenase
MLSRRFWLSRDSYLERVPGFVEFHLLKGPEAKDHTLYASHTVWQSKAAFEAWTKSEEFRAAHAPPQISKRTSWDGKGPVPGGASPHPRRGPAHRRQHRQATDVVTMRAIAAKLADRAQAERVFRRISCLDIAEQSEPGHHLQGFR